MKLTDVALWHIATRRMTVSIGAIGGTADVQSSSRIGSILTPTPSSLLLFERCRLNNAGVDAL
jgi:hypothetical protein